ncbi:type II toxin-antitoxin system VapC family toxin [Segnochrobactrum spirostomi]|uniref:Type II toxin-antitoxin system VapC family toxin n=1 Tax=Segnochrobactrum spirostomi TaxID=2608987 RepID=A0A6A7Y5P5_9HYPH|nr:type II toxin-antitoxin system VapC family toxin [Segnochrobactrum spirostomi]MQT14025.1 type II toxin-antitoxin system VapC family toxin [Segnochrobactrum spirostomi]
MLDASIALSWLFEDEWTDAGRTVLLQVSAEGAFVPSIWHLEVANGLRSAVRRGRCDDAYVGESLGRLARLPLVVDGLTATQAWGATRDLSSRHQLTPYDASYLELALRRGLALASCDKRMIEAATREGLNIFAA